MGKNCKGELREMNVGKDMYFSEEYFSLRQLASLSHQINHVMSLQPRSVLEIGLGNGFLSTILRRGGVEVTTVDINPSLEPDIVSSISDLESKNLKRDFGLVVCCEVLEHMPFKLLERNLEVLRLHSNSLYLTLPEYRRWFGFGGWLRIPKKEYLLNIGFHARIKKSLDSSHEHFWEVNQNSQTSNSNIIKKLENFYPTVKNGQYQLNPYHRFYICE